MSIIVVMGNASPGEAEKPFADVSPSDPDLLSKADVLKGDGYDPANDEGGLDMVAARLNAYTRLKPVEGHGMEITTAVLPVQDALDAFNELRVILPMHFLDGALPQWVESSDETLATLLSQRWGCPIGRPDDWIMGDGRTWGEVRADQEQQAATTDTDDTEQGASA